MRRDPGAVRAALAELDAQALRRSRRRVDLAVNVLEDPGVPESSPHIEVAGRRAINFCGNDYLGLARHPAIAAALIDAAHRYGVGSGASALVTGFGIEHERLEEALAEFTGRERALLFSSGYLANLGVIAALAGRGDLVLEDRLAHASLIDAARLSGARLQRYPHADAVAAEARLAARGACNAVVATDGVFSMDGDLAPLVELAAVARRHDAWLLVDDAHGLGVLGATGRGSLEHARLGVAEVPLLIGTLGKAFGCFGAFVAGDRDLIDYLLQHARTAIYSTALPQAVAAASAAALRLAEREGWRRTRVRELTERFRAAAAREGIVLPDSTTPIQPLLIGDSARAIAVSERLAERGYWVSAIRPPTVPRGSARLRITLSAAHRESEVDGLVRALAECLRA
jgi:8-amino-7-oxononanoate synthase